MCHVFECVINIIIFIVIVIDSACRYSIVTQPNTGKVKCSSLNYSSCGRYYCSFVLRMDCLRACLIALFPRRKVKFETEGGSESLAFGENLGRDCSGAVFGRSIDEQELEKVNCWPYFEISQRELFPQYSNFLFFLFPSVSQKKDH